MNGYEGKKIGAFRLSGLMIGPILGSGIIILPPLIYDVAGDWAIFSWLIMIVAGCLFAVVFGRLSILHPGGAGVAAAIEEAFGTEVKNLTCYYLIGAVLFGPIAVMLTAAEYLQPDTHEPSAVIASALVAVCGYLLLKKIDMISLIALIMSTVCSVVLFTGGVMTLLFHRKPAVALQSFSAADFGYGLLLLFWTIVGWEVVGSYSGEVKNPKSDIMRAVFFSAAVIAIVSLVVSGAVQMVDPQILGGANLQVTAIVLPIFGEHSWLLMSVVVLALCVTTYLLFVGGVARLAASLAEIGALPGFLSKKNSSGAPLGAVMFFGAAHLAVLLVSGAGYITIEILVALADGFFIANASIGLAAAWRLLEEKTLRGVSLFLCVLFLIIFLQSSPIVITIILGMALVFCFSISKVREQWDKSFAALSSIGKNGSHR